VTWLRLCRSRQLPAEWTWLRSSNGLRRTTFDGGDGRPLLSCLSRPSLPTTGDVRAAQVWRKIADAATSLLSRSACSGSCDPTNPDQDSYRSLET